MSAMLIANFQAVKGRKETRGTPRDWDDFVDPPESVADVSAEEKRRQG